MITLKQHLEENAAQIRAEAAQYAKQHSISLALALRDVLDAYREGYCESMDAMREDWDYGRE